MDYLLKPFSFERFLKAVHKATNSQGNCDIKIENSEENRADSIFLRDNKKYIQVDVKTILFLESSGNYVKVFTTTETITIRQKISELLQKIAVDYLLRVHMSYVVSTLHIKSIEGNRIFIQEHEIPIGKLYKTKINELLR